MDKCEKDQIIKRYNNRLEQYGYDIRTLASGTEERRNLRYKILSEIGLKSGDRILDLGCGFGDFYSFLKYNNINVDYTGYDINNSLLEIARNNHPNTLFQVKDVILDDFPIFDFIVSSSVFNLKLSTNNYKYIEKIFKKCYEHVNIGIAIDFLSSYVDYETSDAFHYQPERIFSIAKQFSKRVCLRHDYELYEFCIYIFKDFKGWK